MRFAHAALSVEEVDDGGVGTSGRRAVEARRGGEGIRFGRRRCRVVTRSAAGNTAPACPSAAPGLPCTEDDPHGSGLSNRPSAPSAIDAAAPRAERDASPAAVLRVELRPAAATATRPHDQTTDDLARDGWTARRTSRASLDRRRQVPALRNRCRRDPQADPLALRPEAGQPTSPA